MNPIRITAYLACAAGSLAAASFEFMMVPLQGELGLSVDEVTVLGLIASAASLLGVFVVGALGDRLGKRRILGSGIAAYLVGAILVATAVGSPMAFAGRALGGLGSITLAVIGVAVLNDISTDESERARSFGIFAAITPITFILGSTVSAVLADTVSWRIVPLLWVALGGAIAWRLRSAAPAEAVSPGSRELVTPVLAGIVLAGLSTAVALRAVHPGVGAAALACSATALGILVVLMRRSAGAATLDLRVMRGRSSGLIAAAILLTGCTNFFFYTNLFLQYRFEWSLWALAILLMVPQLAAAAGGLLGGRLSRAIGPSAASAVMLLCCAAGATAFLLVGPESPPFVPIALLACFAIPNAGSVAPLTQALLDRAPAGGSSAASAVRSALGSLSGIVGGITVASIAYGTFTRLLAGELEASGMPASTASEIAQRIRAGDFVAEIAAQLQITDPQGSAVLTTAGAGLNAAQAGAVHVVAVIGALTFAIAAALMLLVHRRGRTAASTP